MLPEELVKLVVSFVNTHEHRAAMGYTVDRCVLHKIPPLPVVIPRMVRLSLRNMHIHRRDYEVDRRSWNFYTVCIYYSSRDLSVRLVYGWYCDAFRMSVTTNVNRVKVSRGNLPHYANRLELNGTMLARGWGSSPRFGDSIKREIEVEHYRDVTKRHLTPCRGLSCAPSFLAHLKNLLVARFKHGRVTVYYPQNNIRVDIEYATTDYEFLMTVTTKVVFEIRLQVTRGQTVSEWGYTYGCKSLARRVSLCNHPRVTSFRPVTEAEMREMRMREEEEEEENLSDVAPVCEWSYPNWSYKMGDYNPLWHFVSEGGQAVLLQEYAMSRVKLYANTVRDQ